MSSKLASSRAHLSDTLKALIKAPHALGGTVPAPPTQTFRSVLTRISDEAERHGAGNDVWLTLSTGALVTMNSPASICELYDFASDKKKGDLQEQVRIASVSLVARINPDGRSFGMGAHGALLCPTYN